MRLVRAIHAGEILVVVRLVLGSHLLALVEQLETAGTHFHSLREPIDTKTTWRLGLPPLPC